MSTCQCALFQYVTMECLLCLGVSVRSPAVRPMKIATSENNKEKQRIIEKRNEQIKTAENRIVRNRTDLTRTAESIQGTGSLSLSVIIYCDCDGNAVAVEVLIIQELLLMSSVR